VVREAGVRSPRPVPGEVQLSIGVDKGAWIGLARAVSRANSRITPGGPLRVPAGLEEVGTGDTSPAT
jgi:hypothetical protein